MLHARRVRGHQFAQLDSQGKDVGMTPNGRGFLFGEALGFGGVE